jgi:signal transduction histidine kinase
VGFDSKHPGVAGEAVNALELASKIYEISLLASQSDDIGAVLQGIAQRVLDETNASCVGIALVDEARNCLVHARGAARDYPSVPEGENMPLGAGVVGQVVATGQPMVLDDVSSFSGYVELVPGMRSEAAVPLSVGRKVIGVLNVESDQLGHFSEQAVAMLQALAAPVAQAIQHARLFQEERRRQAQLTLLNRVSRIATSTIDLDELLERTCEQIRLQLGYYLVAVGLVTEDGRYVLLNAISTHAPINLQVGHRQRVGEGVVGEMIRTGRSLLISDTSLWANYIAINDDARCEMCCPLKVGSKVIGYIDAESTEPNAFDQADVMLLETIADHISQAVENARNLSRMTQLREDLAGMIVHDLRGPTTVVNTALQMMRRLLRKEQMSSRDLENVIRYVTKAEGGCEQLLSMIDGLLRLQKMEAGEMPLERQPCSIGGLINDAVDRLSDVAAARGIAIDARSAEGLATVSLDADLFARVMQNLVTNALEQTSAGGNVEVVASHAPEALCHNRMRKATGLLLEVRDTGAGIAAEDRERIFQKFATFDRNDGGTRRGTGLGLAFCRMAVLAHGGDIWVDSELGEGSTFSILLPLDS